MNGDPASFARLLAGEVDEDEAARLLDGLAGDPARLTAWREQFRVTAGLRARIARRPPSKLLALVRGHRRAASASRRRRLATRPRRRHASLVAALIVIAAALAVSFLVRGPDHAPATPIIANLGDGTGFRAGDSPSVPAGGTIRFPDGSRLELAPGAGVRLESGQGADGSGPAKRIRLLHGALTCHVTPQPAGSPLQVVLPRSTVTVRGTRFRLVSAERDRISVEEGRVDVDWGGGLRSLDAGAWLDIGVEGALGAARPPPWPQGIAFPLGLDVVEDPDERSSLVRDGWNLIGPISGSTPPGRFALSVEASDPDGDPLHYRWSLASGPPGATARFGPDNDSPRGDRCTVAVDRTGGYVFAVTVSDAAGASVSSATQTVTCVEAANGTHHGIGIGAVVRIADPTIDPRAAIAAPETCWWTLPSFSAHAGEANRNAIGAIAARLRREDPFRRPILAWIEPEGEGVPPPPLMEHADLLGIVAYPLEGGGPLVLARERIRAARAAIHARGAGEGGDVRAGEQAVIAILPLVHQTAERPAAVVTRHGIWAAIVGGARGLLVSSSAHRPDQPALAPSWSEYKAAVRLLADPDGPGPAIATGRRDDRLRVVQLDGPIRTPRGAAADAGLCDALAWQGWSHGGRTWLALVNSAAAPVTARIDGTTGSARTLVGPPATDGMVALPAFGVSVLEWGEQPTIPAP